MLEREVTKEFIKFLNDNNISWIRNNSMNVSVNGRRLAGKKGTPDFTIVLDNYCFLVEMKRDNTKRISVDQWNFAEKWNGIVLVINEQNLEIFKKCAFDYLAYNEFADIDQRLIYKNYKPTKKEFQKHLEKQEKLKQQRKLNKQKKALN